MKKATLLLASIALLSACKKDSENTASKTDMLTAKNWRVSAQTTTTTINGQTSTSSTIASCDADDFIKFNTDKTLVDDEGATKCNSSSAQTTPGTWSFNSDESKLTVTESGVSTTADIKELSSSVLHLYATQTQSQTVGGTTISYTYTTDVTYKSF
ncbi:MAG: lipocalin family protein [Janthinobacterium lividum]